MVLQRTNFEIPARFRFRPFSARWEIRTAELLGWPEEPKPIARFRVPSIGSPMAKPRIASLMEREQVTVRIYAPGGSTAGMLDLYGIGLGPSHTVEMYRDDIPQDVLPSAENRRTSPDISGRTFSVLVCSKPEFKSLFPQSGPGDAIKNAWAMRDEFLNLDGADSDDPFDWLWSLRQFLNRWGLWAPGLGYHVGVLSAELPGFAVAFPHQLRERREEYRKALERKNARKWLSTTPPLNFTTIDEWPHFLAERFYCDEAIRTTITIDHLADRKFGFCKRCGKQFEQETAHKKNYCSRQCIQAAGVKRWRDKQRKASRKGAKHNAKG